MIRNQWYVILESKELKIKKPVGITRFGMKLIIWRTKEGEIGALKDQCVHRGAALSIGKVIDNNVQCPFHGLQYDRTGKCVLIPANGINSKIPDRFKIESFMIKEKYDFIWFWYGDKQNISKPIPFFEELDNKFSYKSYKDNWNVHYSRAVENQLDVVHLPFVHYNTIGRGNLTLVNGPKVKFENNEIKVWVFNSKDDGSIPKKPEDIQEPNYNSIVKFKFPNLWRLMPFSKMSIFIAFVPVDEENSVLYMRTYQKLMNIPILRSLFNWISMIFSKKILNQDKRVVTTQQPKKSSLKMGEQLIQGDNPIIIYRRHRQELIDRNS